MVSIVSFFILFVGIPIIGSMIKEMKCIKKPFDHIPFKVFLFAP